MENVRGIYRVNGGFDNISEDKEPKVDLETSDGRINKAYEWTAELDGVTAKQEDGIVPASNGSTAISNRHGNKESDRTDDNEKPEKGNAGLIYNVSDSPPIYLTIIFGLQQALLSLSGNLTISLLVAEVVCAENDEEMKAKLLGTTLFMSGITTLMMIFVGVRLPLFQGAAGDYVIPLLVLVTVDQNRCVVDPETLANAEKEALLQNTTVDMIQVKRPMVITYIQQLQGSLMVAGFTHMLIGATGLMGVILRFIGPVTIVPSILLIGIYIVRATVDFAKVQWGISAMTCMIALILALYLAKFKPPVPVWTRKRGCHVIRFPYHQMFAILIAILIGWAVCGILTVTDAIPDDKNSTSYYTRTDSRSYILHTASWFYFPYPGQFGPIDFNVGVFIGFLIATFTSILDSLGDYYACASMCQVPPPPAHAVNRGIAIEGLMSAVSGVMGCGHATTTYGGNIGAIGVTKAGSRKVFLMCGIIYVLFGILGKITAVFICIPYPVLGGALITMFGMFTGVVLSNLRAIDLSSTRNLAIVGTGLFVGLMVPYWVENFPEEIATGSKKADDLLKIILGNPILFGGVLACVLDNTVPGTVVERGIATWQCLDLPDVPKANYAEGSEIYVPPLPARLRRSKILRFIPFLPNPTS